MAVYHTTYKCPVASGDGPGNSPNNPIALNEFDEAWQAAADESDGADGGGFDCKWIKLSGYFRWTDYYDYRGRLYSSSAGFYRDSRTSYLIEDFAAAATRRSEFQATQIEIVGQFYNLCAHVGGSGAAMIFGPCHYNGYLGMMLHGVRILSIAEKRFQILTGEPNRPVIGDLREVPSDWNEKGEIVNSARDWLSAIAQGRAAYERAIAARLSKLDEKARAAYFDPDGWLAALLDPKRSKLARLKRAISHLPLRVFYVVGELSEEPPDYSAISCFCLEGDCRDEWPLFADDAARLADRFVCVDVEKDPEAPKTAQWTWLD